MKKRPIGFSILAIILWFLTLAAVANAMLPMGGMYPAWAFAYAVTAFIAAFGLWRVRTWAFHAFLVWSALVVLIMFEHGRFRMPLANLAIFLCFILILLASGGIYVKKTLRKTVEQPHQPDAD